MGMLNLYTNLFKCVAKDPDGRSYQKVSRVILEGILHPDELWIDINSDILGIKNGDLVTASFFISTSPIDIQKKSIKELSNNFDCLMLGKVFNIDSSVDHSINYFTIYISCGGLLAKLR